ncbi:hypothetical protein G6F43_008516 [Rhizopus delemar]|nr:hypothetical protein G6F43_008516 [Rhizopus delemar]
MPTTRSTVEEQPQESIQTIRERRYASRKKRNNVNAQSPKQKIMMQFLNAMIEFDKQRILWSEPKERASITLESIEDRVYKGKYKDLGSFKTDIDTLFLSVLPSHSSKDDMNTFKSLYQFAQNCLKFESNRLGEEIDNKQELYKTIALFRPSIDGYVFSDTLVKDPTSTPSHQLPQNIHEMVVYPSQPAKKEEIPTLKQTIAPPPNYPPKMIKHEDKPVVPIQWLDFGAFSSFAPTFDSNNANVSYESTYIGREAKRVKRSKPKEEENAKELNEAWLAKEGLDMKQLLDAIEDKKPDSVEEELAENYQFLQRLIEYQESRIEKGESVDEQELQTVKLLQKNITNMLSRLPPNATANNTEIIEKTMENIPSCEPAYRGSLQPHKIFSYPTTEKAENLPPYANLTPTYTKENWRLVKVPAVNDNSLISMVEQQQINFYTKPPAFVPPQQPFIQHQPRK